MSLQDKYKELIDAAHANGIGNLQVNEQGGVLHIDGDAPTGAAKEALWNIYQKIDPNFSAGDLTLNINAAAGLSDGSKLKVTTSSTNLNIRKEPSIDAAIVGKAAHNETVSFVRKENDQWWVIKTDSGVEGFASSTYLTPVN